MHKLHRNFFIKFNSEKLFLRFFGVRAISHAGPAVWNSLPDYIQSESNTKLLKKLLKTYLFTLSF